MSRRKHEEEEHSEGMERWLLTYADMITLLLALFIILYSMSNIDLQKFKALAQNLGTAFNKTAQTASGGGTGTGTGTGAAAGAMASAEAQQKAEEEAKKAAEGKGGEGDVGQSGLDQLYVELKAYVQNNNLQTQIEIQKTDTFVKISLKDRMLFFPDSATMMNDSKPVLQKISDALTRVYGKISHITISGHTATVSNNTETSNNFAWQLSTERAVTVLNYLTSCGLPEKKLSIEGYSHFNPVAPNISEENRAKNRRVDITILKPFEGVYNK